MHHRCRWLIVVCLHGKYSQWRVLAIILCTHFVLHTLPLPHIYYYLFIFLSSSLTFVSRFSVLCLLLRCWPCWPHRPRCGHWLCCQPCCHHYHYECCCFWLHCYYQPCCHLYIVVGLIVVCVVSVVVGYIIDCVIVIIIGCVIVVIISIIVGLIVGLIIDLFDELVIVSFDASLFIATLFCAYFGATEGDLRVCTCRAGGVHLLKKH